MAKPLRLSNSEAQGYGFISGTPKKTGGTKRRKASAEHERRRSLVIQAKSDAKAREVHMRKLQRIAAKQAKDRERARIKAIRDEQKWSRQAEIKRQKILAGRRRAVKTAVRHTEHGLRRGAKRATHFVFGKGW